MRYFYGVTPRNRGFSSFLSILRFLVEPDAVRFPHVTLRGPYSRKIDRHRLEALNQSVRHRLYMRIICADNFFQMGQNTVLLRVDIDELRELWDKPLYPDGVAHITLYDGSDHSEAVRFYNIISKYNWCMTIGASALRLIEPKVADDDSFLVLTTAINKAYSKFETELDLPPLSSIPCLRFGERLKICERVLERSQIKLQEISLQEFA